MHGLGIEVSHPDRRDVRHRVPSEQVAAGVLRARARPRRGVSRRRPGWAGGTTTRRSSTRAATPSTPPTSIRSCRSSSAAWATTRSARRTRSCSSIWSRIPSGCRAGWAWTTPPIWSRTPGPNGSCTCAAMPRSSPTSSSSTVVTPRPHRLGEHRRDRRARRALRGAARQRAGDRVADRDLPRRRRSRVLLRLLPAGVGTRDPPALAPARPVRAGVVRVRRGRRGAATPLARRPAPRRRGAARRADRRAPRLRRRPRRPRASLTTGD